MDGGLTRWLLESLVSLSKGILRRKQPLVRQAARFLEVFEAHDVPPLQLARLLPEHIRLKPQDTASPELLSAQLRLEHLDWAAETLALRREWLDLQSEQPHQSVRIYKQPRVFYRWLQERARVRGNHYGSLHVLTENSFDDPSMATGRFAVIYAEGFAELDDKQLNRYWYLSEGAHFSHPPCVIDLLCILTIAERFSLLPVGHIVRAATLADAENGKLGYVPRVLQKQRRWTPQNWIPVQYNGKNCPSNSHRSLWGATRDKLIADGLEHVLNLTRPCHTVD